MALTLDATVGGASANTYALRTDVDTLAEELIPVPVWAELADDDIRNRCLVAATRQLDRLRWVGRRATDTQALAWPRSGARTPGPSETEYSTTEVPAVVVQATARLALWLAAHGQTTDPGEAVDAGLASISLGSELSMSFEAGAAARAPLVQFLDQEIRPRLGNLVYAAQPRVVRG